VRIRDVLVRALELADAGDEIAALELLRRTLAQDRLGVIAERIRFAKSALVEGDDPVLALEVLGEAEALARADDDAGGGAA
jgi:hypothetical protein